MLIFRFKAGWLLGAPYYAQPLDRYGGMQDAMLETGDGRREKVTSQQ
jgi:hypothetical protein